MSDGLVGHPTPAVNSWLSPQVSCKMTITKMMITKTPMIVPMTPLFMSASSQNSTEQLVQVP